MTEIRYTFLEIEQCNMTSIYLPIVDILRGRGDALRNALRNA